MAKKFDIMQLMSQDILNKFENLGYDFLVELGYYIPKRPVSEYRARILGKQLKENKRVLVYKGLENKEKFSWLFWWEYHELTEDNKEGAFLCRSQGLKVEFKKSEKK